MRSKLAYKSVTKYGLIFRERQKVDKNSISCFILEDLFKTKSVENKSIYYFVSVKKRIKLEMRFHEDSIQNDKDIAFLHLS